MRLSPSLVLVASALGLGTACSEPIAPESLAGTYVLARVGEQAMPGAFVNPMTGDSVRIHFDSLVLARDGNSTLRARIGIRSPGAAPFEYEERWTALWRVEGRTVQVFDAGCPPGSFCTLVAPRSREFHLLGGRLVERNGSVGAFVRVRVASPPGA